MNMNYDSETIAYRGDDIIIEEMPQGCVVTGITGQHTIVIYSYQDAKALIDSLQKMINIQFGEEESEN